MNDKKTAGSLALKAASDSSNYDSLEVGYALCNDVLDEIWKCIDNHRKIINEDEFCVVMVLASDPLLKNLLRRKFYAWPYLPKPRPRQTVFLYQKGTDTITRLWTLPEAFCMAALSEMPWVSHDWQEMKAWSDAFYNGRFWEYIRKQHGISMLSEHEYLKANSEKLIQAGCQKLNSRVSEPFDFTKIKTNKVVDAADIVFKK